MPAVKSKSRRPARLRHSADFSAESSVFTCTEAARALGVTGKAVRLLEAEAHREFPNDAMMRELHLLRAVKAAAGKARR